MRREWELEELIECWTLDKEELALLANKSGATRLGFGLMLKFFELEARFPRREDVPRAAVEFMAGQVRVDAALFASYDWSGRTIEYHRAQVRKFHGFSEPTVNDEDRLADWLAADICPMEMSRDRLRSALLARCREVRIEPPKTTRIERVLGAAEAMFERQLTETTIGRLSAESVGKLEELIVADDPVSVPGAASAGTPESEDKGQASKAASRAFLQELKEDPGGVPAGHAAGGDREAGSGEGDRPPRRPVRGCVGEGRGGMAGPGDEDVPLGFRVGAAADPDHAAGGAVPGAAGGAHRRSRGAAGPAGPQDQRAGGEEGRGDAGQRPGSSSVLVVAAADQAPPGSAVRALRQDQALHRLPTVGPVGLRTWDYAFCSDFFFGCWETVVSLLRCPYTVERGTPNRSAICWTVLTRAS